jgi:hypothetical protein
MMTDAKILKSLAGLPNSKTTAYTVPAGKSAYIKSIVVSNTGGSTRSVKVHVKQSGGTSTSIWEFPQAIVTLQRHVDTTPMSLAAGDVIEWEVDGGSDCHGNIFGVEVIAQ